MDGRTTRLKKQLDGNPGQPSQPELFVIFLAETLHNCRPILEALTALNVAYERHGNHFQPGPPDEEWLPMVGENNWSLLTHDRKFATTNWRFARSSVTKCVSLSLHPAI